MVDDREQMLIRVKALAVGAMVRVSGLPLTVPARVEPPAMVMPAATAGCCGAAGDRASPAASMPADQAASPKMASPPAVARSAVTGQVDEFGFTAKERAKLSGCSEKLLMALGTLCSHLRPDADYPRGPLLYSGAHAKSARG